MTPSTQELNQQLQHLTESGLRALMDASATKHGLKATLVYAIASRETNCVNELGDREDGSFHGVGVMQIDSQHPIANQMENDGTWATNPGALIEVGCMILAHNWTEARMNIGLEMALKTAVSGYNCGSWTAIKSVMAGHDSDEHTTGGDYGADVLARMAIFDRLVSL